MASVTQNGDLKEREHTQFFCHIHLVVTVLSHRCNFRMASGNMKVESRASSNTTPPNYTASWHNAHLSRMPAAPMCRRKQRTPGDLVSVHAPSPPQESLQRNGRRTSRPAKASPNLDNAGPIVRRLMGLPVVASCNTDRYRTSICSNAVCAVMQCLRPLCYSGGPNYQSLPALEWSRYLEKLILVSLPICPGKTTLLNGPK